MKLLNKVVKLSDKAFDELRAKHGAELHPVNLYLIYDYTPAHGYYLENRGSYRTITTRDLTHVIDFTADFNRELRKLLNETE